MTDAVGDLVVIVKASRLTCEPSYMIVPNLARTCDGLAIGWRLVIVQLPVTDLLDRRFASRQHYETTDRGPMVRMACGDSIGTLCALCDLF